MVNRINDDEKILLLKKSFSIFFRDVVFEKFFDFTVVCFDDSKCLRLLPKSSCINTWWMSELSKFYSLVYFDGYIHLFSIRNIRIFSKLLCDD